jgi:Rrf2 family protein
MIFNKTTEYAIRILTFIQKNGEGFYSANLLHKELDLPYKYVTNLLTTLAKAKLLEHKMGRNGGFFLAKDPKKILLKDIARATNDLQNFDSCVLGHAECSCENPCSLHEQWVPIKEQIGKLLTSLNLEDLGKVDITKL